MEMVDMRYKPRFLPQVSAPYTIVLQKLDNYDVGFNVVKVNPNELKPLHGITFSDKVGNVNLNDTNPIWISHDNHILDGHHRVVRAMLDDKPIKAVRIYLNYKDACRILNKIQDIYEYEQSQSIEEVEVQDTINFYRDDDNQFLNTLEEDNNSIQDEKTGRNQQTIIAYRKNPIKENSSVGNFFVLNPIGGYDRYEIIFDNLLDTNALGITYKDSQQPIDILAKSWFPHINFEKLGEKYNVPPINLKSKAVAEKAKKMGYDGIKYGDIIIQGLK